MGGRSGTVFQLCSSELIFPVETCCQNQKGGGGPCPSFFFHPKSVTVLIMTHVSSVLLVFALLVHSLGIALENGCFSLSR